MTSTVCDFPGCGKLCRNADRFVCLPRGVLGLLAIPLIGNVVSLIGLLVEDTAPHLCDEHQRILGAKR